mgnify:CR=1 FL=1
MNLCSKSEERGGINMDENTDIILIREIESKDYISIDLIWRKVFDLGSITDESVVKTCEKIKNDDRYHIFVADMNGKVIGFVTIVESLAINLPNGYIKVNGLAVLPEFQCCGVGKMLMRRVEKLAVDRNVSLIEVASGFKRTNAHEFYEHLGYRKTSYRFSKRI